MWEPQGKGRRCGIWRMCLLATLEQLQRIRMRLGVECVYVCVCVVGFAAQRTLRFLGSPIRRVLLRPCDFGPFFALGPASRLTAWQTRRILNSVYARTCRTLFLCALCRLRCVKYAECVCTAILIRPPTPPHTDTHWQRDPVDKHSPNWQGRETIKNVLLLLL